MRNKNRSGPEGLENLTKEEKNGEIKQKKEKVSVIADRNRGYLDSEPFQKEEQTQVYGVRQA